MIAHCWQDNAEIHNFGSEKWVEAFLNPATCMLEAGHDGPHFFTPDEEIMIAFDISQREAV